jgi:hypothetical protein
LGKLKSGTGKIGAFIPHYNILMSKPGNTKGESITVPLTSCLTGLKSAVWQVTISVFIFKTD